MANIVVPDQAATSAAASLIWVSIVCPDLSAPELKISTVMKKGDYLSCIIRGLGPGKTQTGLLSYSDWLES